MGGDVQTLCQNASVLTCLIKHIDEIRVFKNIGNLRRTKQILNILRDTSRQTAPFTESFPDFYGISCRLFIFQKQVELINIVSGRFSCTPVGCQHTDFLQLVSKLLNVKANQAILNVHIGSVVKQLQRTLHIDFQSRCHMMCFLFILHEQCVIQILQNRHILWYRIIKILLIDLMHTTVDNCLFYRLQTIFASHNQFAERKDKISFQRHRIIIL